MFAKRAGAVAADAIVREGSANDRFKRTFGAWLWSSVIFATVLHFAVIRFFPPLSAADVSFSVNELTALELPPEVEIPPPPEAIQRPAVPVVSQAKLDEDVTIAPTTFEENPIENLPPPPSAATRLDDQPVFTPYTVAPKLRDPARAAQIVREKFPSILREAGIGGTVVVWAFIDETGVVKNCKVHTPSGYSLLDQAALESVMEFRYHPALNYDKNVPVWISVSITFKYAT